MTNRESQDREQSIARRAVRHSATRSLAPSPTIRIEADVENVIDEHVAEATGTLRHAMNDLRAILGKDKAFDLIVTNAEELKIV